MLVVVFDGSESSDAQLDVALLLSHIEMHAGAGIKLQILGTNGNYGVMLTNECVRFCSLVSYLFLCFFIFKCGQTLREKSSEITHSQKLVS